MTFDYLQRVIVDAQIDVDNIGDCVIQANNDVGEEFYLVIKTTLGQTEVLEYGPCIPDLDTLQDGYTAKYTTFQFSQPKIERIIDRFLNDAKRVISQARICEVDDIRDYLINPIDKVFPYEGGIFDE